MKNKKDLALKITPVALIVAIAFVVFGFVIQPYPDSGMGQSADTQDSWISWF